MAFNKAKAMQEAEKLVSQRKNLEAIKQYSIILERDPTDLALLNTIGDLYFREKNTAEALKAFNKLGDAFMKDGFTVKAIAIFKKISKIDPNAVDALLKLGELYVLQGLSREAREQYAQAVEFYKKKNQPDRALDAFRKIVGLDPANLTYRTKLAEFAEKLGRKEEAAKAYLELADAALGNGDAATTKTALQKALDLDPKNSQGHLLHARLALKNQEYAQVEKILESVPELKASLPGRQLLLESYLASQKLESAEKLVSDVFRADPSNFSPLSSFAALCMEVDKVDAALVPLRDAAGVLVEPKESGPLMDILRQIWAKYPQHVPTLELVRQICEKTADEAALPEVLNALARAYEHGEELEKAEAVYDQLVKREPTNEDYQALLKAIRQRQGKEAALPSGAALAEFDLAAVPEVESEPAEPAVDTEQVAMVKEALENSDLFSRYGLIDKAVIELEKVLAVYPEQADIHQRIFEVCHRTQPARASQAAEALEQILKKQGDLEGAKKYQDMGGQVSRGGPAAEARPSAVGQPVLPSGVPPSKAPAPVEVDLSDVFSATPAEEVGREAPQEVPLDLAAPLAAQAPVAPAEEMDLSTDFAALTEGPAAPEVPVIGVPTTGFNFQEASEEIEFYLGQGFIDEARNTVLGLEERFPGNAQVAELRRKVEGPAAAPTPAPAKTEVPVETAAPAREAPVAHVEPPPVEVAPVIPPAPPEPAVVAAGPAMPPEAPAPQPTGDLLGSLVGDLEAGLEGFGEPTPPPPPQAAGRGKAGKGPAAAADGASQLSGLLDELDDGAAAATDDDPDKHYNLGVAFREMGLLDEAIGEFQKVVKGAQKDNFPPNFLQACSLLAICFTDKGMPAIAAKWYMRALELPGLDEESVLALQYDLGVAYEQAGDTRTALEKFSEVYSENIDFRDVAEKIRTLQQKAR